MLLATLEAPCPTARRLRPADVLGAWQFYIDAAARTVTVELQAGGSFRQTITGRGQRIVCPGGTWTLDGAHLQLDCYRSALRGGTTRVRWVFGDWEYELVLFAQDDAHHRSFLAVKRGLVHFSGQDGHFG